MKVYVAGERGAKERKVRDVIKLETPQGYDGYLYHGMVLYQGCIVVVGSMAEDAPYWCDLDIPMRRARQLLGEKTMDQQERINAMAQIMVTARQSNEDVGELIAASLKTAAKKLGNAGMLVSGRPGSWEADIVIRMATTGGYGGNQEYVEALSIILALMGDARADGGDELSQAMGKAVDTLGGLDAFAGTSDWYHDLINIGCQYSKYDFSSASVYHLPDLTLEHRDRLNELDIDDPNYVHPEDR